METAAYALLTALYTGLTLLAYRWGVHQGRTEAAPRRAEPGQNAPSRQMAEAEQAALQRQRRIEHFRG